MEKIKFYAHAFFGGLLLITLLLGVLGATAFILQTFSVGNYSEALNVWCAAIILSATLALLCFQYANVVNRHKTAVEIEEKFDLTIEAGEGFFEAGVVFIFATILFVASNYFSSTPFVDKNQILSQIAAPIAMVIGFIFLLLAVLCFSLALLNLAVVFGLLKLPK